MARSKSYDALDPEIVKTIVEMARSGQYSQRQLVQRLNENGIRTQNGALWQLSSLQTLLKYAEKTANRGKEESEDAHRKASFEPPFDFPDLGGVDKDTARYLKREVLKDEKDLFAAMNKLQKEVGYAHAPYTEAEKLTTEKALAKASEYVEAPVEIAHPQGRGAQTRRQRELLLQGTGLADLPDTAPFAPYKQRAEEWMASQIEIMRRQYEMLGPGVIGAVGSAAHCWALHRFYNNAVAKDPIKLIGMAALAARHASDVNTHLKAAHDLAKRENEALKRDEKRDVYADLLSAADD